MSDEVEVDEGKRSSAAWRLLAVGREVLPALSWEANAACSLQCSEAGTTDERSIKSWEEWGAERSSVAREVDMEVEQDGTNT
jgi:hypothetical protein